MLGAINEEAWASAVVNADGTTQNARGCSVSRPSAGTYEITLARGINVSECTVVAQPIGDSGVDGKLVVVEHNSDDLKTIRFFFDSAGLPQNTSFHLRIAKFVG